MLVFIGLTWFARMRSNLLRCEKTQMASVSWQLWFASDFNPMRFYLLCRISTHAPRKPNSFIWPRPTSGGMRKIIARKVTRSGNGGWTEAMLDLRNPNTGWIRRDTVWAERVWQNRREIAVGYRSWMGQSHSSMRERLWWDADACMHTVNVQQTETSSWSRMIQLTADAKDIRHTMSKIIVQASQLRSSADSNLCVGTRYLTSFPWTSIDVLEQASQSVSLLDFPRLIHAILNPDS